MQAPAHGIGLETQADEVGRLEVIESLLARDLGLATILQRSEEREQGSAIRCGGQVREFTRGAL